MLPVDLLLHCFEFLSIRDLECSCAPVNKGWAMTRLTNSCWKQFCVWNFGVRTVCSGVSFSPYLSPVPLASSSSSLPQVSDGWWRLLVKQRKESDARLRLLLCDTKEPEVSLNPEERVSARRPPLRIEQRCKKVVEFEDTALDVLLCAIVSPQGETDKAFSARCVEKIAESLLTRTLASPLLMRTLSSFYCGSFTQEFKLRTPMFGPGFVPIGTLSLRCTSHWRFALSLRPSGPCEEKEVDLTPFFFANRTERLDLKGATIPVSATCHWHKVKQESDPPLSQLRVLCSRDTSDWVQDLYASVSIQTESETSGIFHPASGVLFLRSSGVTRTPRPMPNAPGNRGYLLLFLSDNSMQLLGLFKLLRQVNDGLGVFDMCRSNKTLGEEGLLPPEPLQTFAEE